MLRRLVVLGATGLVVVLVAALGVAVWSGRIQLPGTPHCTAEVNGHEVTLETDQAENAALIAAISVRRGMPARAASIALAAAMQESKLRNLDHGDRDSIGLFQQRPSQGWGTRQQILNPVYAINQFYDALAEVENYRQMRITEAAQAVQRSAYPEAYADHAKDARILASALTGYSDAAFSCVVPDRAGEAPDRLNDEGLTPRAADVREALNRAYGDLPLGGFAPGGVDSGHSEDSAHYDGRAIDIFVRPISEANQRLGWSIAHFLVAHAAQLDISVVIFDGRIWSQRHSEEGWRPYEVDTSGVSEETAKVLEHRDHVHVAVID